LNKDTAIYTAYDDFQGIDSAEAEKNLMRAILKSAMDDIRKHGEAAREALHYFLSEEDYYLYSFLSVCRHLGLCHKTIRTVVGLLDPETPAEKSGELVA
jgi:hypothetical protein